MDELKKALMRTGYFEMVDIQTVKIDDKQLDVHVNVVENLTKKFHLSGGVSNLGSKVSFMWSAGIQDRNFLGTGTTVNVDIENDYYEKEFIYQHFTVGTDWITPFFLSGKEGGCCRRGSC
jgi:outer membrane protein insertion porin family